jgi:8-oxo-dGTP pyrophosphatase MutT (NUDIX family)
VFPGGKVAEADADPAWARLTAGEWPDFERSLRVAAAREVFEESGLLLAVDASGKALSGAACEAFGAMREEVEKDPARFLAMIGDAGLRLTLDRLVPHAHWITPAFEPKRFDTYFFLVIAPADQTARHDGREAVDHEWLEPLELLERRERGEARLMFPTRLNLAQLARSTSAADAEMASRARKVVTVEPQVIDVGGAKFLRIPAEADYGLTDERIDRVAG